MSNPKIAQFILNRKLAQIKRYHATPLHQNETVAEHSFYVAIIARSICGLLAEQKIKVDIIQVMEKALIHDMEEMFTGDIIQPYKYADVKLKSLIDQINTEFVGKAFEGLPEKLSKHFNDLWVSYHHGGTLEDDIVKIADRLSLVAYCIEQIRLGNTFMIEILENGLNLLSKTKYKWLKAIIVDIEKERSQII